MEKEGKSHFYKIVNSFFESVTAFVIIDEMGKEGLSKNRKKW